ncbi:DUF2510 domain-containing protein [Microlunatus speluncae]|uniref:DUF2510 domain-containing protein n=1 Tax=Microlunatus speluncae TaxID=2594267 RepID=UPI0013754D0C|nr:DUF2510 domain-containing protein [Microlunatus speluncae]
MTDRAGWYADPSGRSETFRWWDGSAWTRWLSADPGAPAPARPSPAGAEPSVVPDHDQPAIRLPSAVAITIGAVILAVILLGVSVSLTEDRLPAGPAIDPPPKKEQPVIALFDTTSGEYLAGRVRMKVPAEPLHCPETAMGTRSGVQDGFTCSVIVHHNIVGAQDWLADTGFGVIPDQLVVAGDLSRTGERMLDNLTAAGYEGIPLIDPTFTTKPLPGVTNPPDQAIMISGTIGFRVPKLPTTASRITIVVIKLADSGRHVMFFCDVPNDAPKAVVAAIDVGLRSITAR